MMQQTYFVPTHIFLSHLFLQALETSFLHIESINSLTQLPFLLKAHSCTFNLKAEAANTQGQRLTSEE